MKKFTTLLLTAAVAASVPMTAIAQAPAVENSINNVTGNVLVERSGEFFRAESSTTGLAAGDRLIAIDGASANISFAGCDMALSSETSVSILEASSCAGTFDVKALEIGDPANDASVASLEIFGLGILASLLAASAVIAGIIIIADDDDPASP